MGREGSPDFDSHFEHQRPIGSETCIRDEDERLVLSDCSPASMAGETFDLAERLDRRTQAS